MTMTNAFIPDSRIVTDDFVNANQTLNTKITDDGANLNTGIANVAPNKANEANMSGRCSTINTTSNSSR